MNLTESASGREVFKVILINILVVLVLLLLVEGLFRLMEARTSDQTGSHEQFRLTQPEPYERSSYWSQAFIEESFRQPGGWSTPEGTRIVLPNDFEGRWFNVRESVRVTVDQPVNPTGYVYLFGGSTVYNSEVPDEFTIASQLQARLNQAGIPLAVVNMGVTSVTSGQQVERLKSGVRLTDKDVVVFYDGVNDVTQGVFYRNPSGWIAGEVASAPLTTRLFRKLAEESAFIRWVDQAILTESHTESPQMTFTEADIEATSDLYLSSLNAGKNFSDAAGAKFFHFLQPTIASKETLNPYEKELIERGGSIMPAGMLEALRATYPVFQERLLGLPWSTDLTTSFNGLSRSPYLDFVHVTEEANGVIANEIFKQLVRRTDF